MPKFYRQNKKRIDPRYFLHEQQENDFPEEDEESAGEYPGRDTEEQGPPSLGPSGTRQQNVFLIAWENFVPSAFKRELPAWLIPTLPKGHAGLAYVMPDGSLRYAEFGGYGVAGKKGRGKARLKELLGKGSIKFDKKGNILSWKSLVSKTLRLNPLAKKMFETGKATVAILRAADTKKLHDWVVQNSGEQPYGLLSTKRFDNGKVNTKNLSQTERMIAGGYNCATWAAAALKAGGISHQRLEKRAQMLAWPGAIIRYSVNDSDEMITSIS